MPVEIPRSAPQKSLLVAGAKASPSLLFPDDRKWEDSFLPPRGRKDWGRENGDEFLKVI